MPEFTATVTVALPMREPARAALAAAREQALAEERIFHAQEAHELPEVRHEIDARFEEGRRTLVAKMKGWRSNDDIQAFLGAESVQYQMRFRHA